MKTQSAPRLEMPDIPPSLDRRPARPNAAFEGDDVPDDDVFIGVIPQERSVVDVVDPKQVSALIADKLGGGRRQYGIADAVLALFAEKRWHVIREG
jgi:hypothetical protein